MIPKLAGGFSAFGLLFSPPIKDFSLTVWINAKEKDKVFEYKNKLHQKALIYLKQIGFNPEEFKEEFFLDMRYKGQGFELTVPLSEDFITEFEKEHEKFFGHAFSNKFPIEVVTLRLRLKGKPLNDTFRIEKEESLFSSFETKIYTHKGYINVPVIDWNSLKLGDKFKGPMLIIEKFTTVWVEEGFKGEVKENYTLILERE